MDVTYKRFATYLWKFPIIHDHCMQAERDRRTLVTSLTAPLPSIGIHLPIARKVIEVRKCCLYPCLCHSSPLSLESSLNSNTNSEAGMLHSLNKPVSMPIFVAVLLSVHTYIFGANSLLHVSGLVWNPLFSLAHSHSTVERFSNRIWLQTCISISFHVLTV